jgi:hypothetical protein
VLRGDGSTARRRPLATRPVPAAKRDPVEPAALLHACG